MIPMKDEITLLAGVEEPERRPWVPFDPRVMGFLSALSRAIRESGERREETAAFGFWCRPSHLEALRERHKGSMLRVGRGLLFHIAPSNVPAMFAYTLAIGMLAGNANRVRLSTRQGETERQLCRIFRTLLNRPEFEEIKARTSLLTYERNDILTARYANQCDGRVVWGGDETVSALRAMPLAPHGVELSFPDRCSMALLRKSHLSGLEPGELEDLAHRFYNDTYRMDQNACSSPRLVIWLEDGEEEGIRARWWEAVACEAARRYPFGAYQAFRKLEAFSLAAMTMEDPPVEGLDRFQGNLLMVARLAAPPSRPLEPNGSFGLFYECRIQRLDQLLPLLSPKIQTLTAAGTDLSEIAQFLQKKGAGGVDRVVPVGRALEMDTIWDGKDLISQLSRILAC